jgi:hypothetical protein
LDEGAQPAATQPKPEQHIEKEREKAGGGAGEGSEKKMREASEKEKSVRAETRVVKPPPLAMSEGVVATAVTPTHMPSPQHTFACEYECGFKGSFEQVSAHEPICRLNGASGKGVDIAAGVHMHSDVKYQQQLLKVALASSSVRSLALASLTLA